MKKFLIKWNLLPTSFKWKKCNSGLAKIYAVIMKMIQEEYKSAGIKKLNKAMYDFGYNQAHETLEKLGLEKNLEGCAYALLANYRIFGIKGKIIEKTKNKIIIHLTHCEWKNKPNWTPTTCASIEQYEIGLVKGILPDVTHICTKRRSLGNDVCEIILSINNK